MKLSEIKNNWPFVENIGSISYWLEDTDDGSGKTIGPEEVLETGCQLEVEVEALSVLLSDLVDVEFERDALKNELAYQKEADRKVLAEECGADEKHCTCAPALYRRIAELEAAFDDAVRALWEYEIEHVRDTDILEGKL